MPTAAALLHVTAANVGLVADSVREGLNEGLDLYQVYQYSTQPWMLAGRIVAGPVHPSSVFVPPTPHWLPAWLQMSKSIFLSPRTRLQEVRRQRLLGVCGCLEQDVEQLQRVPALPAAQRWRRQGESDIAGGL